MELAVGDKLWLTVPLPTSEAVKELWAPFLSAPDPTCGLVSPTLRPGAKVYPVLLCSSRFGSRCARIFRLVLQKKHLEQKQVEDFAMIPAKEAKDMLYKMLSENFISLQVATALVENFPSLQVATALVENFPSL